MERAEKQALANMSSVHMHLEGFSSAVDVCGREIGSALVVCHAARLLVWYVSNMKLFSAPWFCSRDSFLKTAEAPRGRRFEMRQAQSLVRSQ
jgi:hypothetical protein